MQKLIQTTLLPTFMLIAAVAANASTKSAHTLPDPPPPAKLILLMKAIDRDLLAHRSDVPFLAKFYTKSHFIMSNGWPEIHCDGVLDENDEDYDQKPWPVIDLEFVHIKPRPRDFFGVNFGDKLASYDECKFPRVNRSLYGNIENDDSRKIIDIVVAECIKLSQKKIAAPQVSGASHKESH